MSTASLGLGITYWLKDRFSSKAKAPAKAADNITKSVKRSTTSLKKMQGAMTAAAGAAVFMASKAALGSLTNSASSFETGMAEVSTLVDTTKVNMKELGNVALNASKQFGIPAVEQAQGVYQAISAGVETSTESLTSFMNVANNMAIGGVTDIKTSVDGLTTVMNAFAKQGLTAQEISDQMFATMKGGKTTIAELSNFMFQAAPIAAAVGIKFSEVNAAIVALTKQGTPTSVAMTQIRASIVGLTRPNEHLNKIFKKTKEGTAEAFIQAHGLKAALMEINKTAKGTVGGMTLLLGSQEAASGALAILSNKALFFDEALQNVEKSAGNTAEAVAKMQNTHANRMARMKARFESLKITIGNRLLEALEPVIDKISTIINKIDLWLEKHPKLTKGIGIVIVILAVLAVAIGAVATVMGILTIVSLPVLIVFAKIIAVVGLVVVAFLLLRAAFRKVWHANQDTINKIKGAWKRFVAFIKPIIQKIVAAFVLLKNKVIHVVGSAFRKIQEITSPILNLWWQETKANLQLIYDAWTIFQAYMEPIINRVTELFVQFQSTIGSAIQNAIGFIQGLIDKIVSFIGKIPLINKAFSIIGKIFNFGKKLVGKAADAIVGEIKEINNSIKEGRDNIHTLAENIRKKNQQDSTPLTGGLAKNPTQKRNQNLQFKNQANDKLLLPETNPNFHLAAVKNPNFTSPAPVIKNEIVMPQAKIEAADILLDKNKLAKVFFEMQQLKAVRQN